MKTFYRRKQATDGYAYEVGWNVALKFSSLKEFFEKEGDRYYRSWLGYDQQRWSAANRSFALGRTDSLNQLIYK